MRQTQYMMLACTALRREITAVMKEEGLHYPVFYLPDELHLKPEKLNAYLCDFIPRLVGVDYLLLPLGRCGNGTLGVPSGNTTVVLPKSEDCISLLLSTERLSDVSRDKYSLFYTDSWLDYPSSITSDYSKMVKKRGRERADALMKSLYKNYKQFVYLDTGHGDWEAGLAKISALAEAAGVELAEERAEFGVLRKMLTLHFDDDFMLIPPGGKVAFD